ncbi:MAG: EAL domain-containing protein [Gaiellaceae bacterium]
MSARPNLRLVETKRRREAQRRRTDRAQSSVPSDRVAAARRPAKAPAGPTLRTQVIVPFGIGMAALVGAVGVVAAVADQLGFSIVGGIVAATCVFVPLLMLWAASILDDAATKPLEDLRSVMREIEEGDYNARVAAEGPREVQELAAGFNQMVTIVGHQRDRLQELAATDALTGLANHRRFHERLRNEFKEARERKTPLAVVALDLDGFKRVNEERGHARGDETLRAVGEALRGTMRTDDLVARLGGDDFALLLVGADAGYARDIAERARAAIARSLPPDVEIETSAGFVCYPGHANDESDLAEMASSALEAAKRAGGGETRKFDAGEVARLPTVADQRAEIDTLLRSENPITPVFQPLVDLANGRLVGYEALARFNSPVQRSTEAWFNQAQRCGRGPKLEAEAIRVALAIGRSRPKGTYLSLNFSPSAIASSAVRSMLPGDLADVVVEITEHELASEDGALEEGLRELRQRGARIAVDDAGAGYAGLKQVMRVQPDLIKLDRGLIEGVNFDSAKSALIEFFVLFARRVGSGVCTEGIETLEELQSLVQLGVGFGQGYLLGRPAEPWAQVSETVAHALSVGSLRAWSDGERAAPGESGPVNRRLGRYR